MMKKEPKKNIQTHKALIETVLFLLCNRNNTANRNVIVLHVCFFFRKKKIYRQKIYR